MESCLVLPALGKCSSLSQCTFGGESSVMRYQVNILHHLSSATQSQRNERRKEYKSGAVYTGGISGNIRYGHGLFIWPDGTRYEGEFIDNSRNGFGIQTWPDGSQYEGTFLNDTKHGTGQHVWSNGETYVGRFFKDHCHGFGVYSWPDKGQYKGTFYMDRKEGYGIFNFPDGTEFEGLYKCDERMGPGVLTYPDGRQDVGLWLRERIIKLCFTLDNTFTLKNCKEYDECKDYSQKCVIDEGIHNREDLIKAITGTTSDLFDYDFGPSMSQLAKELLIDILPVGCVGADLATYDEAFFELSPHSTRDVSREQSAAEITDTDQPGYVSNVLPSRSVTLASDNQFQTNEGLEVPENDADNGKNKDELNAEDNARQVESGQSRCELNCAGNQVVAWNSTPSCMRMQAHILRHQLEQKNVGFDVDSILSGSRGNHGERGPIEESSERFLRLASESKVKEMERMLHCGELNVDVGDANGQTALFEATVNMHNDVINCLLDNGADVNKLNDEGLSALAICVLSLCPPSTFKSISDEEEKSSSLVQDSKETKKMSTNVKAGKKKSSDTKVNKKDSKRIQELKQELGSAIKKNSDFIILVSDENVKHAKEERKLGTISIQRVERMDPEQLMALNPFPDPLYNELNELVDDFFTHPTSRISDFDSNQNVQDLPINVSEGQVVKCAEMLSQNEMVISHAQSADALSEGIVRCLAIEKSKWNQLRETMKLLLKRGANPNASTVPMPALFFVVRAGDVEAVRLLLSKCANPNIKLTSQCGGMTPLHYACLLPGEEGVQIVELLLNALADPDAQADPDDSYFNHFLEEEWNKDVISPGSAKRLGGKTPLHMACARTDNFELSTKIVCLMAERHANFNLLCNGHSPLSLAITSGNDKAVAELLRCGANASLHLTHGVGSALCAATLTFNEPKRKPEDRIALIDKLVKSGANMFTSVPVGPKRQMGTVVDYAHYIYSLDRKIANTPYNALSPADRETFTARRDLLEHLGHLLRMKAIEEEMKKLLVEDEMGIKKRNPSANFVYTGCLDAVAREKLKSRMRLEDVPSENDIRGPSFHFCYECGRSIGVLLEPCSRCKAVFYCSKPCQNKAWEEVHKHECLRVPSRDRLRSKAGSDQVLKSMVDEKEKASKGSHSESIVSLPDIAGAAKDGKRRQTLDEDDSVDERKQRKGRKKHDKDDSDDDSVDKRKHRKGRGENDDDSGEEKKQRKSRGREKSDGDDSGDKRKQKNGRGENDGDSGEEKKQRKRRGQEKSDGDDSGDTDDEKKHRKARGRGDRGGKDDHQRKSKDRSKIPPADSARKKVEKSRKSDKDRKKGPPSFEEKFGYGKLPSWKADLPENCHIGNYSFI